MTNERHDKVEHGERTVFGQVRFEFGSEVAQPRRSKCFQQVNRERLLGADGHDGRE